MSIIEKSIIQKYNFEKVAETTELSHNIKEWKDEILGQFSDQVEANVEGIQFDIQINKADEEKGYGSGSIVVWKNGNRINFPIIIKNYQLSPFDVFIKYDNNTPNYYYASSENIEKAFSDGQLANITQKDDAEYSNSQKGVKRPGGAPLARLVPVNMSGTPGSLYNHVDIAQFNKLSSDINEPEILNAYAHNTGDLIFDIIEDGQKNLINDKVVNERSNVQGKLKPSDVVDAKKAVSVIESEILDPNELVPINHGEVAEFRIRKYPTMEDFLSSDADRNEIVKSIGKGKIGVCLRSHEIDSINSESSITSYEKFYIFGNGQYSRTLADSSLFGTYITNNEKAITPIIESSNKCNQIIPGLDDSGVTTPIPSVMGVRKANMGSKRIKFNNDKCDTLTLMFICKDNQGNIKVYHQDMSYSDIHRITYNSSIIYYDKKTVFIPANINTVSKVSYISNPEIRKALPDSVNSFILYPETANIITLKDSNRIIIKDFINPDTDIKGDLEVLNSIKTSVEVGDMGFNIKGKPVRDIIKIIGGLNNLSVPNVINALKILGVDENITKLAMKESLEKYRNGKDSSVDIYGANPNPVNIEKAASYFSNTEKRENLLDEAAKYLNRNLVKEASEIDDPEAVETVLSLNFINKDNIKGYVEMLPTMEKISGKVASLLIASRLGLKSLNEDALKAVLENIGEVINGLHKIKASI